MFLHSRKIHGFERTVPTLVIWLFLTLLAVGSNAAEPVEVLLKGHDETVTGYLRQISDSRFLLQGENIYHEFPGNQIVTIDGEERIPDTVRGNGRLIFTSFYEKILPDGDVEVWSHNEITNEGVNILTGTDWGGAAWEEDQLRSLEVYDSFNNRLPVRVIPKGEGFRVEVDFLVPVAPRESLGLSLKTTRRGHAKHQDGVWSYTFNVGFNEDRYLTRKIELPSAAELVDAYAWCRSVEMEGRQILISQRYYPAMTEDPLTIKYRLP